MRVICRNCNQALNQYTGVSVPYWYHVATEFIPCKETGWTTTPEPLAIYEDDLLNSVLRDAGMHPEPEEVGHA